MVDIQYRSDRGMIQFEGIQGQLITTPLEGLTTIRGKDDFTAYFGTKGSAKLTETEYKNIHKRIGLSVPSKVAPVSPVPTDDDSDFTT